MAVLRASQNQPEHTQRWTLHGFTRIRHGSTYQRARSSKTGEFQAETNQETLPSYQLNLPTHKTSTSLCPLWQRMLHTRRLPPTFCKRSKSRITVSVSGTTKVETAASCLADDWSADSNDATCGDKWRSEQPPPIPPTETTPPHRPDTTRDRHSQQQWGTCSNVNTSVRAKAMLDTPQWTMSLRLASDSSRRCASIRMVCSRSFPCSSCDACGA